MTILIDTHYLLWFALRPERIEPWAAMFMKSLQNSVLVSATSIFEIGFKVRFGKLPEAAAFESDLMENIKRLGFTVLGLSPEIMLRAARLPSGHRDPFDRMIAAHSIELDVDVLSVDAKLDSFGVRRLTAPQSPPTAP